MRNTLPTELKLEILIKLAFGIEVQALSDYYGLSCNKIINLRKNNYVLYNKFIDHWRIDEEIAKLNYPPKYEKILSIIKKHYKHNFAICNNIIYIKGNKCTSIDLFEIAAKILEKDDIVLANIKVFKNIY